MRELKSRLLNLRQAAQLAGVSERTFHNWVQTRKIRGVRRATGGRIYYEEADVLALRETTPESPAPGPRRRNIVRLDVPGEHRQAPVHLADAIVRGEIDHATAQTLWERGFVALVRKGTRAAEKLF